VLVEGVYFEAFSNAGVLAKHEVNWGNLVFLKCNFVFQLSRQIPTLTFARGTNTINSKIYQQINLMMFNP
jgi:hypothetical protein